MKKQLKFKRISEKVDKITDNLGKPIEQGIKRCVIGLMLHNFELYQSCEGHLDKEGLPYPWIIVDYVEPKKKNWRKNEKLKKEYERRSLKIQSKMIKLLDDFYKKRKINYDTQLFPERLGFGFRLKSIGGSVMDILPEKEKREKLKKYQKEIDDFGKFLKLKYFNS